MTHRVVVVDDAADLRMLLVLALRRDGRFDVVASVSDGQQGVEAVREHAPDVVLMDIAMPVMDGLTATRLLKSEQPGTPIAILTGYGDDRVEDEARAAGADAFIDKTRPIEHVVAALASLAEGI